VCLRSFSFFSCFSHPPLFYFFTVNHVSLFLAFDKVADVICDSLNYTTFLNILCTALFYPFLSVKLQKYFRILASFFIYILTHLKKNLKINIVQKILRKITQLKRVAYNTCDYL
jgi:hypothetical protein